MQNKKRIFTIFVVLLCFLQIVPALAATEGVLPVETQYNSKANEYNQDLYVEDEDWYIKDTFGYTLKGDPNYTTDETFFSRLNYKDYPGMEEVKNFVDQKDYANAKVALLEYYRSKQAEFEQLGLIRDIKTTKSARLTADLLCKNFMYNGNSGFTIQELLYIENEPKYYGADVTSTIAGAPGTYTQMTFYLLSTDKNGDYAEFDSKEGGIATSPYLEIKVNGSSMTLYPTDDTYISPHSNKETVYGDELKLYAHEDGIGDKKHINNNTRRITIKFDISALKPGDTISAANFYIHGHNQAEGATREVVLFTSADNAWTEETRTYSNTTAQVMYSFDQDSTWTWQQPENAGYRFEEEWFRFNTWWDVCVSQWNRTGDEKYAYTCLRTIMDFYHVRGQTPAWRKTLDVSVRSSVWPKYSLQLMNSKYMTPEIFTAILKLIWSQGDVALGYANTGNNWGTYQMGGLFNVAAYFPEFLNSGELITYASKMATDTYKNMMLSDLSSNELAQGYTSYSINNFATIYNLANTIGVDFPVEAKQKDVIEGLTRYLMYMSMPGYHDNQEGDSGSYKSNFNARIKEVATWWRHPHLLWAATDGEQGEKPDFTSLLLPEGKKAVMRTGWDENANYLYTSTDGGIGSHAHPDDNHIIVQAYGQYLLVDPLYGSYSEGEIRSKLISTRSHNTVCVNNKNQTIQKVRGSVDRWETNDIYDFISEKTTNNADARHTRSILFVKPGFWLVSDYLQPNSGKVNSYVQAWHFLPDANISSDAESAVVRTNNMGPNIQVIPVDKDHYERSEITDGYFSYGQGNMQDAKYMEYEQEKSGDVVFNTILLPENTGVNYEVNTQLLEVEGLSRTDASAYEIEIVDPKSKESTYYQYFILHNTAKSGVHKFGYFTTDANMLLAEYGSDGTITSVIAEDVSFVEKEGDKIILKSDDALSEYAYTVNGTKVHISSSTETLDTLTQKNLSVLSLGEIKSVSFNKVEIDSMQTKNGYVYFGNDTNVPEGNVTPTPPPNTDDEPSADHGKAPNGSGGSGNGGGSGSITVPPVIDNPSTNQPEVEPMPDSLQADLENHWAKTEIEQLYRQKIVLGDGDTFHTEQPVTRAEFAALVLRTLGFEETEYKDTYSDVSKEEWYSGVMQAAYENGIMQGDDGKARPDDNVTREEMAAILANALKLSPEENKMEFVDNIQVASWAEEKVAAVVESGLMNGYPDNSFRPLENATRAEAFVVIYRMAVRLGVF